MRVQQKKVTTNFIDLNLYIYYLFGQKTYLFDAVNDYLATLFEEDISDHTGLERRGYLDKQLNLSEKGKNRLREIGWPAKMTWDFTIFNLEDPGNTEEIDGEEYYTPRRHRQLKKYVLPDEIDRLEEDIALIGPMLWPVGSRNDDVPIVVHLLARINDGIIGTGTYLLAESDWYATFDSVEWHDISIDEPSDF